MIHSPDRHDMVHIHKLNVDSQIPQIILCLLLLSGLCPLNYPSSLTSNHGYYSFQVSAAAMVYNMQSPIGYSLDIVPKIFRTMNSLNNSMKVPL